MLHKVIVFVFCTILIAGSQAIVPSVTNSTIKTKQLRLLGVDALLATYTFSFDEDLYLHKSNYCPSYNCAIDSVVHVDQESCVCDFTNTATCGSGFLLNSTSTSCSCDSTLCNTNLNNWTDVSLATSGSQSFKASLQAGQTKHWRLFIDSVCKGFRAYITTTYGTSTLYLSTDGVATPRNSHWERTNVYQKEEAIVCPTSPHFVQGTYFVAVTASTDTVFDLTFEDLMVAQPNTTNPETCGDLSSYPSLASAQCLYDGVPVSHTNVGNASAQIPPYVFNVTFSNGGCTPIFIALEEYDLKADTSFSVSFLSSLNTTVYSSSFQESFVMCPQNNESWTLILIKVTSKSSQIGATLQYNYRLTVSTSYFENHWTHTLLADIPLYEVNFDLLGTVFVNTTPYSVQNQWVFNGTGFVPIPSYSFACTDWKTNCVGLSFTTTENPLFPVPPIILNLPGVADLFYTVEGNYSIPVPAPTDSKSFSAVVVLSYETNSYVLYVPENATELISINFLGKIGNKNGETITGSFKAKQISLSCNYQRYKTISNQIQNILDQLDNANTTADINALRYQLDSMAFQDDFSACVDFVDNLTVGYSSITYTVQEFYCPQPSGTLGWFLDACCNQQAQWTASCFPRNVTEALPQFLVQEETVKSVCKNVECSQSYLEDYASAKAAFESGQCSIDVHAQQLEKEQVIKQYKKCKDQAYPFANKNCWTDQDCIYQTDSGNVTYACSLSSRTCEVPYQVMERTFVDCLRTQLTEGQATYLAKKYGFDFEKEDSNFTDAWLAAVTTTDCVTMYGNSINLVNRKKVLTVPVDLDCADLNSCPVSEGEDFAYQYPDITCYYACGVAQTVENANQDECIASPECNWDSSLCDGADASNCSTLCQTGGNFCGFCDSSGECTQFPEITSPAQCAASSVCVLPNGTYYFNLTDAACDALTKCDLPYCGRECAATPSTDTAYSAGICFSYEANSTSCTNNGGTWMSNTGPANFSNNSNICVYSAGSQAACSFTWESCGSISLYSCGRCANGKCSNLTQNLMACSIFGKPCTNASVCTSSGICSDSEYFVDLDSTPLVYGSCTATRAPPTSVSGFPYCPAGMTAIPKQCMFAPSVANDVPSCATAVKFITYPSKGTRWMSPAEDQASCLNPSNSFIVGCKELYGTQDRISLKNQGNCTSQYTQDEWVNVWEWKQGTWIGGVQKNLTWTPRQSYSKYNWTSTVDFLQLENDFLESAAEQLALESKSSSLCQYHRTLVPMQAVTCDCTGGDSSNCFEADPVSAIAQTQVCQGTPVQRYSGVRLAYNNDTEKIGCADVLISKISQRDYQTFKQERLLANFIPLADKTVPQFAIKNKNGAVVGQLLTDGVKITSLGGVYLGPFELCILLQAEQKTTYQTDSSYPVLDFGSPDDKEQKILPLGLVTQQKKFVENTVYDGYYLCATVGNFSSEKTYFAIERTENFESQQNDLLSPTALALTYTLAVMFLVASLITTAQLLYYTYGWIAKSSSILLEHFLSLFIWLFVTVRTIYFFLLADGFNSAVADYALVALPTFFYFTAFSIIVVLWAVVAGKRFTSDVQSFKKIINAILIIVNTLLYALFVALVLGFQFANTTTASPCSGRQDSQDNSSQLKRQISIAYGMIIAGISLIIGVLFVIFGFRLRTFIAGSQTHEKLFIVTAVCSGCFILHSAFVVAVSFLSSPNLYFSFFGLIITEWFPAIFIVTWTFMTRAVSERSGGSSGRVKSQTSSRTRESASKKRSDSRRSDVDTTVELSIIE